MVGDVHAHSTFKEMSFVGKKHQHLITSYFGVRQNRFCCAMDSNTIDGETIMQHHPHSIYTFSI
jgi:hypothetical protein